MPFPPYHFGPSGFVALTFRKWIDVPVFMLANVAVDVEVAVIALFGIGWPSHRFCHSIAGGIVVGIALGLMAYPFMPVFKWGMNLIKLPYQKSSLKKLIISGILGVWLHVFIDAIYHWDLRIFWPSNAKPLYHLLTQNQVKLGCLIFWVLMIIPYIFAVRQYYKKKTTTNTTNQQ